jgi:hypothetical protein
MTPPLIYAQARQQAAHLLLAVLNDQLTPDVALTNWPRLADSSLQVAYQALLHFSVDLEGYHQTEVYYADMQLQWLNQLAQQLGTGQPLPYASRAGYKRQTRFYWKPSALWLALQARGMALLTWLADAIFATGAASAHPKGPPSLRG